MDNLADQIAALFQDESDDIETVEEGDWEQDSKDQLCTTIVKHVPTGRHFAVHQSRRGSPWTDWDYGDASANEVVPVEVTRIEWKGLGVR